MSNEVRWIDRNTEGKICGHYARKQREGQECLPEDHTELVTFDDGMKAQMELAQQAAKDKEVFVASLDAKIAELDAKIALVDTLAKAVDAKVELLKVAAPK